MLQFTCTIKDPMGIHARPAGLVARAAKAYADTTITIERGGQSAKATQLMRLMSLGVKQGDEVTVAAEGPSEAEAIEAIRQVFAEYL
ncbi:MAG: HPr family phosphocarrier protein [Clostridia bacterium]|nr:HPr family phosphocarrier protein [Clostridia bacterium]